MDNTEKKRTQKSASVFDMIVYGMMIAAVIFIIIQTFTGKYQSIGYRVSLGAWILIAVAFSDYIGPMYLGELEEYDGKGLKKYVIASVLDAAAYMCLYLFIIFVGEYREVLHYIALGAAVLLFAARAAVIKTAAGAKGAEEAEDIKQESETRLPSAREQEFLAELTKEEDLNDIQVFKHRNTQ